MQPLCHLSYYHVRVKVESQKNVGQRLTVYRKVVATSREPITLNAGSDFQISLESNQTDSAT